MAVGVSSGPNSVARTKKIFVGGLAATVSEHDFRKYFDQFGSIADVVVMYDHATQRPRGFGFITYDSEDGVERVLQKSFHELKGKMVEVKRAIPKEMSPSPIRSNGGGPSFAYGHFNPSPIGPFASRMDSRYSPSPGTGFSPYGAVGYGSNSSRNSFISAMNAGYNSGSYGGANTPFGRNFGPGPSSSIGFRAGGYGAGSGGYGVSGSTPGRNLWSTGPMTYGSNNLVSGYGYNRGSSIDTYSGGGLGSWPSGQNPNSNGGYGNSNVSYGSTDGASYGSNNVGYNGRGNGYGSSSGIYSSLGSPNSGGGDGTYESNYNREMYNSFGYRERSQKTLIGTDPFSPSAIGGSGFRGYGLSDNGNEFVSGAYTTSPFVAARQSQRGQCIIFELCNVIKFHFLRIAYIIYF